MSALFHNIGNSRDFDAETIPQMYEASDGLPDSAENESDHFLACRCLLPLIEVEEIYFGQRLFWPDLTFPPINLINAWALSHHMREELSIEAGRAFQ